MDGGLSIISSDRRRGSKPHADAGRGRECEAADIDEHSQGPRPPVTGLSPEGAERSGAARSEAEGLTDLAAAVRSDDLRTGLRLSWPRVPGPCPPTLSLKARGLSRTSDAGLVHREGRAADRRHGRDLTRRSTADDHRGRGVRGLVHAEGRGSQPMRHRPRVASAHGVPRPSRAREAMHGAGRVADRGLGRDHATINRRRSSLTQRVASGTPDANPLSESLDIVRLEIAPVSLASRCGISDSFRRFVRNLFAPRGGTAGTAR